MPESPPVAESSAAGRPGAEKSDAFVLAGSFLVVCRSPAYLAELTGRGLKILLVTPAGAREEALAKAADPDHPAAAVAEFAFVDGDPGRDNSYLPGVVSASIRWREKYHLVGACAVGETQVEPIGLLADAIGAPTPGLRATRACRSKYLQRWYLPEFGPDVTIVPAGQREGVDPEGLRYPVVLKPAGRHSSSGVQTVGTPDRLSTLLTEYPAHETLLIEDRVSGQEYSVESLVQAGRPVFTGVTRKDTTDVRSSSFVELSHTVPGDRPEHEGVLLDSQARMLAALDFRDGVAHAEWRIDADGRPVLMEVAARTPGDGLCVLYELATGASLEQQIIRIALGEPADYPAPRRVARQVYLEHTPGVLRDVTVDGFGIAPTWVGERGLWPRTAPGAAGDPPALRAVLVHQDRGARLRDLRTSEDRAVSFLIDAATPEALDVLEAEVRAAITVHTDPAEDPAANTVTHVLVGHSPVMLGKLDSLLPAGSVLVLEEPDVIEARRLDGLAERHACVAALLPAPTQDETHPERLIRAVPRPPGVRAVVPVVEYAVVTAAALAEEWGLPGAGTKAALALRDKGLLRATLHGTDVDQPAWTEVTGPGEVAAFRAAHGGETVLKPANRQASLGVHLLGPGDDVAAAWEQTTAADEPTLRARHAGTARHLAEQRLHGPEVSVEAVVHEGALGLVNITAKTLQSSHHPVETGHTVPAVLPAGTEAALRRAIGRLAETVGFGSGILHSEWILAAPDGLPHLVECAGRMPGGGITALIDLAHDTDILACLLTVLEGRAPVVPTARRGAAVRFLTPPPGRVAAVTGTDRALAAPGVREVHVGVEPGAAVRAVTSSWERSGYVIATGADHAEAARNAEHAAALIDIATVSGTAGEER
ncbi:ATP-grasp domain-containing protein [Streptomyces sp. NPDC058442]|uniref:ATP-grasp domain-containing protein n=1 Tax=Streptomyces sp. NPDC058442 TaxID=3346503 RepID=UPI0036559098